MAEVEIALRHDPRSSSTWSLRAVVLGRLARWDDAIASAEHAVELDPGSEGARTNLTTLWRDYLAHCRELLEEAGFAAPATASDRARQAAFLREAGLIRAAEQLLPRSGLPAPPGSP
jgi:Flp pilus assembly protein TadD